MITKTLKTVFFIIAVASFSFGSAQEKVEIKHHRSDKMFQHLDVNADNTITYEEFMAKRMKDSSKEAQVKKRFASIDTDKNGTVNRTEFRAFFEGNKRSKDIELKKKAQSKNNIKKKG